MALHCISRPERKHAYVRGDARRIRGERRDALPRSRAHAGRQYDAAPGGESERACVGALRRALERHWKYHLDDPKHLFRPWGFQPGHQTEWAKLLLILDHHRPQSWLLPTARHLFDTALAKAWDEDFGGIVYGVAPDDGVCDSDKYFWVQAESFA